MITQRYNLNLIPDKVPVQVNCSQYDALSRTIEFTIYDGAVLYEIPSGTTATVRGTKSDNTGFEYPCTIDGSVVSFEIQDQMTIFNGRVPCEIRLTNNGILGTCNFNLNVEPTPLDPDVTISDTYLPLLEDAEQNAVRAEQAADEAEALLSTVVKSVNETLPDAQGNVDVDALPNGGTTGQVLTKQSNVDGDADWEDAQNLSAGTGIDITNAVISNKFSTLQSVDLNTVRYNYQGYSDGSINSPSGVNTGGEFACFATSNTNTLVFQMYIPYNTNTVYTRQFSGGSGWTAWEVLAQRPLIITSASFSSLPQTITNTSIKSDHVVMNSVLSNPSAQTDDWTVTTSNGSLTISGSISGSTTLTLYLMRS